MEETGKRTIEIAGVKVEVDLRQCKQISEYKVGDGIKVLRKRYQEWEENFGILVGFGMFATHPSIELLVTKPYSGDVDYLTVTSDTTEIEIAPLNKFDATFTMDTVLAKFDRDIEYKENEIRIIKSKKAAFKKYFGQFCAVE